MVMEATMTQAAEYTAHNFDAINRHIGEVYNRDHAITSARKAGVFSTYAKYGALLAVALGVMGLLLLWGLADVLKPEPKVIEKEVVVEKPVEYKPVIHVHTPETPQDMPQKMKEAASEKTKKMQNSAEAAEPQQDAIIPVYNYVIFKRLRFNKGDIEHIVVGMRYEDSNSEVPSTQWCYVERPLNDGTTRKLQLATKLGDEPDYVSVRDEVASEMGTDAPTLVEAQSLCLFQ